MIEVSISVILSVYIAIVVTGILFLWFYNEYKTKSISMKVESEKFFWSCSTCTYTYVDSRHKDISICPRCGSYNKKED